MKNYKISNVIKITPPMDAKKEVPKAWCFLTIGNIVLSTFGINHNLGHELYLYTP